jgi:hypothetical protein
MPDWKPGSQAGKPVDVQMLVLVGEPNHYPSSFPA